MTDETKKGKRVTFEWSDQESVALDDISQREPFLALGSSRRAIVRYLILLYAQQTGAEQIPATKADVSELMSMVKGLAMIAKVQIAPAPTSEPARRTPKAERQTAASEEKEEAGIGICEALGGVVSGKMCSYKKYEKMATGRPVSFDVSEPLASLSAAHITMQFDPSREEYDRAVAEWKEGE